MSDLKQTLAQQLKQQLARKGITQTMMARALNIPEMTVSNWMKGKTYPRPDKLQRLADYFGITRSELTEELPHNLTPIASQSVAIPILGTIACGDPITAEENIKGYYYESPDTLPSGHLICLEAAGESMSPTIPHGSVVLIREQPEVESGEVAAVLVNGATEATLKRVKKQGDTLILVPDNPSYDPIVVNENNPAKIIGKAIKYTMQL
ncbi:LexA family protein [Amphibacillus jilinensis]|uniref:LexA family protein n=1 Tax=Amphibacillus jilinensis TaxID=1216008 RepID=UPI0002DB0F46|nr:XRE family transcriptional regulator [Amphibacillus jilinensis]